MPDLRNESYDEEKGEWFPHGGLGSDNPDTRTRAMYFFHNSLGEVTPNQEIEFVDTVTTGGGGDGSGGWDGPEEDIQSWPIKDLNDLPIETYSNGDTCYRYRFNWNNTDQEHTRLRVGVWQPVNPTADDLIIYNRYIKALKFIFGGDNASIKLSQIEDTNESIFDVINTVFPFDDIVNFPNFNENAGNRETGGGQSDYNIDERFFEGSEILIKANVLLSSGDLVLPNKSIGGGNGLNSGVITWNAVPNSSGSGTPETQTGQFIVGNVVENYNVGDYLLLEATDGGNHFHDRVVFVQSPPFETSDEKQGIEIQFLDDEGFLPEPSEPFTITKLTNAPKLKIKYKETNTSTQGIVIVDDVEDVED